MESFVKFVVEIKNGENRFLEKMTPLLHYLIIGFKSKYSILPWIDRGYMITNEEGTDRIYTKRVWTMMYNVQESLAKLLSKERTNDSTQKSQKILGIIFALLHTLKKQNGMTTVEIGWDHSIIILLKTEGEYEGDASDRYESAKAKVKSCFEATFCPNGKVSVTIQNLTTYGIFIHFFFSFIKYITLSI